MTLIKQEDLIQSVADAFQFISYYHPADDIRNLHEAYKREESPAAKDAMAQILINSRMAAEGHRPICQDTGRTAPQVRPPLNRTAPLKARLLPFDRSRGSAGGIVVEKFGLTAEQVTERKDGVGF